ncbi:zinc-ribbon domain-containing protein [Paracoccus salsus]|uniref:zinc-ribbon domain-containing protein n=1 Tax=Paracoccus salsus TaxID=2911061 RepID=UPI001F3800A5|nr:zinc-ribbon domain-containing protein [Paracoccus salsus]MCF3973011.1 zinc-ribbon domain-containing protein [Paracoccus salsus]
MGEIRLICPGCGAEYRLPSAAVPATGREVECTACGRIWKAGATGSAPPAPASSKAADESPEQVSYTLAFGPSANVRRETPQPQVPDPAPLARRVPASVLTILREEVEHERRARQAENARSGSGDDDDEAADRMAVIGDTDTEWPATTVTGPADRPPPAGPQPVVPAGATRAMVSAPAPQPDPTAELSLPPHAPATQPTGRGHPAAEVTRDHRPASHHAGLAASSPGSSGYSMGFGLAAMIAAVGLTLYLLAPGMSDEGTVGEALAGFRQMVDRGRIWLQAGVSSLFG